MKTKQELRKRVLGCLSRDFTAFHHVVSESRCPRSKVAEILREAQAAGVVQRGGNLDRWEMSRWRINAG